MTIYCKTSTFEHAIDEVRAIVKFYNWQNETFVQSFTTDELIQLHRYCMQSEKAYSVLDDCPDLWSEKDLEEALTWNGKSGISKIIDPAMDLWEK